jgi:cob(I)alamin adenosyltransferase
MIRLDRIYTRSGDAGKTSLGDASRVDKISQRIVAMGAVDEVNCHLGTAASLTESVAQRNLIHQIQQLLFDLGADLCCPLPEDPESDRCPRIAPHHSAWLETKIDAATAQQNPLTSFILPGGSPAAAALHLGRAVCRRAELEYLRLVDSTESAVANPEVGVFLNRLSDLLFVLARQVNNNGAGDILWSPGSTTE